MNRSIIGFAFLALLFVINACDGSSMTDPRDGKTYKTVKIGSQIWMAENLNYAYTASTSSLDSSSFCYDNNPDNCAKYGRLYLWSAAMDSAGLNGNGNGCGYKKTCSPTFPVQGVCPSGWHLPTPADFDMMFAAIGGVPSAGKMLKSTSGWNDGGNGKDSYSFAARPAGRRYYDGKFLSEGEFTLFWMSIEVNRSYAPVMILAHRDDNAVMYYNDKDYGFSVRCVKD